MVKYFSVVEEEELVINLFIVIILHSSEGFSIDFGTENPYRNFDLGGEGVNFSLHRQNACTDC